MDRVDNGNVDARGKPRVQTTDFGESMTVQSDADKADIKKILGRYKQLGIVEHLATTAGKYMDITGLNDFTEVMRTVRTAELEFMQLPSKVREQFDHDVAKWLDAAHDPEKRAELEAKGVIESDGDPLTNPEKTAEVPPE